MLSSIKFRLWLSYALIIGIVVSIAGAAVVFYFIRNPANDRIEYQRLRLISNFLIQRGNALSLNLPNDHQGQLQDTLERTDRATGLRIVIMDESGDVIADSRNQFEGSIPQLSALIHRQTASLPIYRDSHKTQWLFSLSPFQDGYYLLVATPRLRQPVLSVLRDEFLAPFTRGVIFAMVIALALSIWIARWVAAPIQKVTSAAQHLSMGEQEKIPLSGPDEVKALAIAFNDMTERVQTSQQAQRDLIANVSHDLKTPLTSIQGFAQAILDGTAQDTDTIQDAARVIYDESGRMNRMVMDLLDLARMDAGTMKFDSEPIDLNALLESVLRNYLLKSQELQIDLTYHCNEDMLKILGDPDLLERAFSNLVDNALKNTPSMGMVSLTARQSQAWLEISVADTGSGIPTDELARIFERFYQTDKSRRGGADRGVGLGLAIATEIIQAHHGRISAYNRETIAAIQNQIEPMDDLDIGSVFVVKLPIIPMHD